MFSDRIFQAALLISLIAHGVILLQNPSLDFFYKKSENKQVEISYLKVKALPKPKSETPKEKIIKRGSLKEGSYAEKFPPPFIDKEKVSQKLKFTQPLGTDSAFTKPIFINPELIENRKKISLPPVDIEKIDNPSYLSYYQIVREKIKRAAYQNYRQSETGEVHISFIISSDGFLKEMKIIEDQLSSSPYLREISLKSIKDALPFPNFPKELDYPQLSFNVAISFEIE